MEKHFTTSVYVYNTQTKKFLFIKHKKLQKWLQPGGHIEENENPEDCAIREVLEETGINARLVGERLPRETDLIRPFALQLNKMNEEHEHFDLIYLAVTDENDLHQNFDETEGIGWFTKEEILDENFDTFEPQKGWVDYFSTHIDELLK